MPRALSPLLSVGRKASLGLVDIGAGEFAAKAAKLIQFLDAERKAKPSTEKVGDVVSPHVPRNTQRSIPSDQEVGGLCGPLSQSLHLLDFTASISKIRVAVPTKPNPVGTENHTGFLGSLMSPPARILWISQLSEEGLQ